jgi:uncharacterized membrane protein YeaQ/YmgE (transglycosylase-associated protein family)
MINYLVWFLIIGAVAGWLAGKVMKGRGFGVLGNIVIGCCGAVLGGFIFSLFGILSRGIIGSLVTSFVGALILLAIVGWLKKK